LARHGSSLPLFQPFGVLVEHRINDVDERLIAVDQTVPAGQQVALQPSFDCVLAEHLHNAAFGSEVSAVGILGEILCQPDLFGDVVERFQPVGLRLIRAEDAEVPHVQPRDFACKVSESGNVAGQGRALFLDFDGAVAEVGHIQRPAQQPAIGDRVGAHPPVSRGGQGLQLGEQASFIVEERLRPVTAQPIFQQLQVAGICRDVGNRNLMRPPEAFEVVSVHLSRGGPALGAAQDDHRPARPKRLAGLPRLFLDLAYLQHAMLEGGGHRLVHAFVIAAFHEIGGVPVTDKQRLQLVVADAGEDRRIVDLVAIEVQDRQHRPVGHRVEEFVAVPAGGQGTGLRLAVADHHEGDQVRVVVDRPIGVRDAVAQLAALVDAAGRFRSGVAADAAGERELLEETLQSRGVFAFFRIDLRVCPFEIGLG
jgi:hypothetical protein